MIYPIFRHRKIETSAWPWPVVLTQALAGAVSALARPAAGAELRRQCGARAEKPGANARGVVMVPQELVGGWMMLDGSWNQKNLEATGGLEFSNLAWASVPF